MKQSYPHCNMKYCMSCFCTSQSSQAGSDICSVCCSHPNPTGSEQHPPCTAISHRHREVQNLQGHPSKSCQHLLLWADTLNKLSVLCLSGGWWRDTPDPTGSAPLPPRPPAPLWAEPEAQQLIWGCWAVAAPTEGVSGKLKPLLDEPLARGRRGTGLCQQSQPGASPQLSAKIPSVTSILWHVLLLLWCTKSNKSPVRSLQTTGAV